MEQLKKAKKMCRLVAVLLVLHATVHAQRGLGTNTPHPSAILELKSTTKGFLIPRMTSNERKTIAISPEVKGLLVFDTDKDSFFYYDGKDWERLLPSSKLDIVGETKIQASEALNQIPLTLKNGDNDDTWQFKLVSEGDVRGENNLRIFNTREDKVVMSLSWDGHVGIGKVDSTFKLDVGGSIRGASFDTTSDSRLKKNIKPLDNSLSKISQLRGISFNWQDADKSQEDEIGVIAQEVEALFPELVSEDNEGYKSVAYSYLVAPLIEAVKELKQQNEAQKKEIEKQQTVNKDIIRRLMALESKNKE